VPNPSADQPAYQSIVLSVAQATGAAYEWDDHVQHALSAGLPQEIVDSIGAGRTETLPHPYALLRAILSKTMAWLPVPDDVQTSAVTEWGAEGLVEIVAVSGFFRCLPRSIKASPSSLPPGYDHDDRIVASPEVSRACFPDAYPTMDQQRKVNANIQVIAVICAPDGPMAGIAFNSSIYLSILGALMY
jgi:hypothetical protein